MSDKYLGENQPVQRTTPTWEVELLISGATVFSLMQLPDPLNRALNIWANGNEEAIVSLLHVIAIYLQFSLITLILTFLLHLIARGYWVALVGMHSVYPQGIRWDKDTSGGPAYREVGIRQMGSIPELIEKADNRATRIFGLGFGMALAMMVASAIVGSMILILMIVQVMHGDLDKWSDGLWIVFVIVFMPFFMAYLADYLFGEKLKAADKDGLIKKIFSLYQDIGIGNSSNPVISLYTTNEGIKKTSVTMAVIMIPLLVGISTFTSSRGISIDNGAYDGLPKVKLGAEHAIRPEYYASSRGETYSTILVPFINENVVSGNYLKLFIPYQPNRHNSLLEKQCPETLTTKAAGHGGGLSCLAKLLAIQIDSQPVTIPLLAGVDETTGQRGMVAMINTRELADGQHELKVNALATNKKSDKKTEDRFHRIPFWK